MLHEHIEGRLIDIPYRTSPPLLFVYQQTAVLAAGVYNFPNGAQAVFTPSRPINVNSLYLFQTLDFACDVDQNDYQGAIATGLQFSMYLQSEGSAPLLREPLPLVKYFNVVPYHLNILGKELLGDAYQNNSGLPSTQGFSYNRLLGNIAGVLNMTPTLLGKASITATLVYSVQEVTDRNFIEDFVKRAAANRTRPVSTPGQHA